MTHASICQQFLLVTGWLLGQRLWCNDKSKFIMRYTPWKVSMSSLGTKPAGCSSVTSFLASTLLRWQHFFPPGPLIHQAPDITALTQKHRQSPHCNRKDLKYVKRTAGLILKSRWIWKVYDKSSQCDGLYTPTGPWKKSQLFSRWLTR